MRSLSVWLSASILACSVAACGGGSSSGETVATVSATTSTAPSLTGELPAATDLEGAGGVRIPDLGSPDWLVLAGGSAWAAGVGDGVGQLDGSTGALLGSVPVPGEICLAMDVGFDAVWVGSCGTEPSITRIDPTTAKVTATIKLPVEDLAVESSVAAGEGAVWAISVDGKLLKIDPETNTVAKTYPAPAGAVAIRAGLGALWVTKPGEGTLLRLDPADASVQAEIPVGNGPRFLAVGENGVWVLDQDDGAVTHVDPATNKVVATIVVDRGTVDGGDIAVGGGAVWARVTGSLVVKIDPATDKPVASYGPMHGSGSVAADDGAVWISAHDVSAVWRLPLS